MTMKRYRITQKMVPLGGGNAAVQPACYAGDQRFAVSGTPGEKNSSVVINSCAAEAHTISESMRDILGDNAPGIFVSNDISKDVVRKIADGIYPKDNAISQDDFVEYVQNAVDNLDISTYTASHRQADAVIRHSIDPETNNQIWVGDSALGKLIRTAGNGMALAENFPNSALLGYWLSQRTPMPTRVARSITSIIEGYDIEEVKMGAVKLDVLGNVPSTAGVRLDKGALEFDGDLTKKNVKPSTVGLGAIPGDVATTGFRCGSIEKRSTISGAALHTNVKVTPEMENLLVALGVASVLHKSDGVYRSGADLISTDTLVEEIDDRGNPTEVNVDNLLDESLSIVEENKHLFAEPHRATLSDPIVSLLAYRIADSMSTKGE